MNYYENKEFISNSMLSWLDRGPAYFLSKLNKDSEQYESKSLENGKLLHSYIEDPQNFVIADIEKPGEKTALFIEEFARTRSIEKAKVFAGLAEKTKLDTLEASLKETKNKNYLDFLELSNGKTCLTKDQGYKISNAIKALHSNRISDSLLFPDKLQQNFETFNELEIYFEYNGHKCKSKLDKVNINRADKTIKIIDLKTTAENPYGVLIPLVTTPFNLNLPPESQYRATGWFRSMFNYSYYRQGAFYIKAISNKFKKLIDDGYTVEFIFVVVELGNTFDVAIYKLGNSLRTFGQVAMDNGLAKYKGFLESNFKIDEKIIEI